MGADLYAPCHLVGGMTADYWSRDPKRLGFVLARYKFVARALEGKARVLEVGCADGFGTRVVRQHVGHVTAVDIDAASIAEARRANCKTWPVDFRVHDILGDTVLGEFDAVYALDVIEHMTEEAWFLATLRDCAPVAILGAPSLESQVYASELSRKGHCNCKTGADFKRTLQAHWAQVFVFSMSDETVHTGFQPMAQYLIGLCVA